MQGWEVPKGHRHFLARFHRVFLVSLALRATMGLGRCGGQKGVPEGSSSGPCSSELAVCLWARYFPSLGEVLPGDA